MAPRKQNKKKGGKRKSNAAPPADMMRSRALLSLNYGGGNQPGLGAWCHEIPIGFTNWASTVVPGNWSSVKRWKLEALKVTFCLEQKSETGPMQMFLGWNRTPRKLNQYYSPSSDDYMTYYSRCEKRVVSMVGDQRTLTLTLPATGWKRFIDPTSYDKDQALFDRDILEYCGGSIIYGFRGASGVSIEKADFPRMVCIDAVQTLQVAV